MTGVRNALIIGGGIAGPATALALQKAGIASTVYEGRSGGADGVGAMLNLATNGIEALRILGAEGAATKGSFETPGITLRTHTGKRLGMTPTSGSDSARAISRTIKRADLYRGMNDTAVSRGVYVERGKRLVSAVDDGDGVLATFSDGSTAHGDVLIGCDGLNSTVRRIIDPSAPAPRFAGLITTGGYANGVETGIPPGEYEMIFGKRAFFGHATAPDGEVWWFVNLPKRSEPSRGEVQARSVDEWRRVMRDVYADDAGPALEIIDATPDFAPMTPIHTIPSLPVWSRGRMIVIGDAAHAPSPTSGQGASLAIEDAVAIAMSLRDFPDAKAAFTAFGAMRRPRVERIVAAAARVNNSKAPSAAGRLIRDVMLPRILTMTANSAANHETFDYRLDWESTVS